MEKKKPNCVCSLSYQMPETDQIEIAPYFELPSNIRTMDEREQKEIQCTAKFFLQKQNQGFYMNNFYLRCLT